MAWRGHEASPPASPPRAGYDEAGPRYEAGHDGLDDLAVAALATLPPQKAASILTKLRNKGGNVRNPSAYVVRSVENAHCHGGGGSLRPQPPPGAVYYVPYYNYGPPPPPDQSPPGFAPSPAAPAAPTCHGRRRSGITDGLFSIVNASCCSYVPRLRHCIGSPIPPMLILKSSNIESSCLTDSGMGTS